MHLSKELKIQARINWYEVHPGSFTVQKIEYYISLFDGMLQYCTELYYRLWKNMKVRCHLIDGHSLIAISINLFEDKNPLLLCLVA